MKTKQRKSRKVRLALTREEEISKLRIEIKGLEVSLKDWPCYLGCTELEKLEGKLQKLCLEAGQPLRTSRFWEKEV